jgi:SAM-dependent methyltransferase
MPLVRYHHLWRRPNNMDRNIEIVCNLCGSNKFRDMKKRKNARCSDCGSLERTRLLWLYLSNSDILIPGARVLHLAPEDGLSRCVRERVGSRSYCPVDYNESLYKNIPGIRHFDLTADADALESESFDLILHSHVIEHIPCNIAYSLFHLHRALKHDGLHACVIPISPGAWDESFDMNLSRDAREKRFGQYDHVRRIGRADIMQTLGKILRIDRYLDYDATRDFSPEVLEKYNVPESQWRGLTMSTPLILKKHDYLLQ